MQAYFQLAGDIAWQETRCLLASKPYRNLPPGAYGLIEFYCIDLQCDCRRVLLQIWAEHFPEQILASINFGWESVTFYTRWMRGDRKAGEEIAGASLDPVQPQSPFADALMDLVQDTVLEDSSYIEELKKHYQHTRKILAKSR